MQPPKPSPAIQRALRLHRDGRLNEAHSLYRSALKSDPQDYHACHLLGVLMHQAGRHDEAVTLIENAIGNCPGVADPWNNLGLALRAAGRRPEAERAFRKALEIEPDLDGAWNNLGNILQELGIADQAIDAYRHALKLNPGFTDAHYNLARLLARLGRLQESVEACRQCIATGAGAPEVYGQLADNWLNLGRPEQALRCAREGLARQPEHPELLYTLGFAHTALGDLVAARDVFADALRCAPDHGGALASLLYVKRQLVDWQDVGRLFERFVRAIDEERAGLTPFSFLAEPSTPSQQQACARLWTRKLVDVLPDRPPSSHKPRRRDRLTIGYLSADFHRHPTAYLTAGLFEQHDRERFRIIGYSSGRDDGSAIRRRIVNAFDEFVDFRGLPAAAAARRIVSDGVDILVDLKGHTLEAPTTVMAYRPAPIQVQYLGYPGTMGAEFIDYVIGDPIVTPMAEGGFFDEHIVQLPGSYQVNDDRRPCPPAESGREHLGLPARGTVLCCFNATWKFSEPMFGAWMRVLKRAPRSVLWLLVRQAASEVRENLRAQAKLHGVDPDRLVLAASRPLEPYLQLYRHADLFLDSLPYNAHTTASDALWMGCPVLTVSGDTFASRVGASLAHASGTADLVCQDIEEFVRLGAELAADPGRLESLRAHLENGRRRFPLFDTTATTRHIERAYREMHDRLVEGGPGPFRVEG